MSDQTPIVDYEESPLRERVTIQNRDGVLRITTAPLLRFSRLNRGYRIGAYWLFGFIALCFITGGLAYLRSGDPAALIGLGEGVFFLLLLFAYGWHRLRSHYVFEVTRDTFAFRRMSAGHVTSAWTFRRSRIGAIHVSEDRKIVVPIGDGEYVYAEISDSKEEVARVADSLAQAVAANQAQIDRSVPDRVNNIDALRTSRDRTQIAFIVAAVAIALAIGFGMIATRMSGERGAGWMCGVYAAIGLMMPVGIILGTQKKEYWQ